MTQIERESGFSRSLENHAKLGAYYTDVEHCKAIARFLQFPEEEDVLCLEPSIGDGEAVKAVVSKSNGDNKHIFGVDINRKACAQVKADEDIERVLCADFLNGVAITPNAFPFVFSNPPYMMQDGRRMEEIFFDRICGYMRTNGVLVYIIPHSVFTAPQFFTKLYNRFEFKHVYRFQASEYAKWKQVCIIGVKRPHRINILRDAREKLLIHYAEDQIPELPFDYEGEKVAVPGCNIDYLKTFTTLRFPVEDCLESMRTGFAKEAVDNFLEYMSLKIQPPGCSSNNEYVAPIHPSRDSMYLLGVCGVGSGLCGDADKGNLHLQRGVVKMVEDMTEQTGDHGEAVIVSTKRAKVTYKIVQQDGTICNLE